MDTLREHDLAHFNGEDEMEYGRVRRGCSMEMKSAKDIVDEAMRSRRSKTLILLP